MSKVAKPVWQRKDEPMWRKRIAAAVSRHGQLKAIATAAGMESPQLQKIANGVTRDPSVTTLARIAKSMGYSLEELVSEPPTPEAEGRNAIESLGVGGAGLADSLGRALREYEQTGQVPKDWRGDILVAIFALTRALQRPTDSADAGGQTKEA